MSEIPKDLLYTEEHEYVKPTDDPNVVAIGITDYAQGELGDIVFIELPKVGATFGKHDVFGTVEAVKAVSELYTPIAGEVVEVNDRLDKEPALVNSSPYGDGWMVKVRLASADDKASLMSADAYSALGGWPPIATGEDVVLARRAALAGHLRTVRSAACPVHTSVRPFGRAPFGFSSHLRGLAALSLSSGPDRILQS